MLVGGVAKRPQAGSLRNSRLATCATPEAQLYWSSSGVFACLLEGIAALQNFADTQPSNDFRRTIPFFLIA